MGFSQQEYWSGLPCPSPGDLPNLGMEPVSHVSCIGRQVFTTSTIWEDPCLYWMMLTWIVPLTKCCLCLDSQPIPAARNSLEQVKSMVLEAQLTV